MAHETARRKAPGLLLSIPLFGFVCWLAPGSALAQETADIAVIVHPKNELNDISRADLARIFLRKTRTWPKGERILFINGKAQSRARVGFDHSALRMSPEKSAAYWIDQRIRGRGKTPRALGSASLVQRIVSLQRTAVGYVPLSALKKGVKVLRVDGRAPGEKGYPIKLKLAPKR